MHNTHPAWRKIAVTRTIPNEEEKAFNYSHP